MRILLNDVTTTPLEPPNFEILAKERIGKYTYPHDAPAKQASLYPDLQPFPLPAVAKGEAFSRIEKTVLEMGWQLKNKDREKSKLEAVAVTRILRFRDDIVIELRERKGGWAVHMRSKSRLGRDDFGANAKRIRGFFEKLSFYFPKESA